MLAEISRIWPTVRYKGWMMATTGSGPPPFGILFREHAPGVLRFLRGMLGPDDAEECLQETFLAALRAYDRFDGAHPRAWLLGIARNKAIDATRAAGRRLPPAGDRIEPTAADLNGHDERLWARVAALPPKQRAAIVLRFVGDLSHREAALAIGCSEPAARRSLHEALKKLRGPREETR